MMLSIFPHKKSDILELLHVVCNCSKVVLQKQDASEWWSRAEKLAIDILEDIKFWSVGWVDWNLVLDVKGGPNHVGNLCDANVIADPETVGGHAIILSRHVYTYYIYIYIYMYIYIYNVCTYTSVDPPQDCGGVL